MDRQRLAVTLTVLLGIGVVSCSSSQEPPLGLGSAPVPESQEDIDSILEAMPVELDGLVGTVSGNEVSYGEGGMGEVSGSMETFLRVMTVGGEEYGTGARFVEAIVEAGGIEIEEQELDPAAPLVYVAGVTPAGEVEYASVMWADPASPYVLLIQGTSEEQRAALIGAYVNAASAARG